ncbi:zinc-binding dehydrogenase [Methylobacterium sp. D48H]
MAKPRASRASVRVRCHASDRYERPKLAQPGSTGDVGVTNRTRSIEEQRAITERVRSDLWQAIAKERFSLPIDSRYPLAEASAALARMKQNKHFGKIVLKM